MVSHCKRMCVVCTSLYMYVSAWKAGVFQNKYTTMYFINKVYIYNLTGVVIDIRTYYSLRVVVIIKIKEMCFQKYD